MLSKIFQKELSLKEAINLFFDAWKTIAIFGLLGFLSSITYLLATPKQYEVTAQIQMAQINGNNNNNNNLNNNPLGVNVEDPNLLLARMRIPSSYSDLEIKACGLGQSKAPAENLTSLANFSVVRGVSGIVELKIRMNSKDQAIACAQALFENIRRSQNQIMRPYIDEARNLLIKYQARLDGAREIIVRADKSDSAVSAAYLASRDEVRIITDEIFRLNTYIAVGEARQTRLISPIYASNEPVLPKKKITLIAGLFLGLLLGFLFITGKKALTSF
jgi:capsular polysaccharide biosynthesis protein